MNSNTSKFIWLSAWLLMGLFITSCQQSQDTDENQLPATPSVDLAAERATLLGLQATEKEAHLTEQPPLLVHMLNDTLCQIKDGEVSYFTHDQMTDRLVKYFFSVEFVKWEDIKPPVITISPDGLMAHILVTKEVEVITSDQNKPTREKTIFAWTELWKKKDAKWKLYTVTSTDKPGFVND